MEEAARRVVFEVPCPEVALGPHRFDIRHRAVIVASLGGSLLSDPDLLAARAEELVAEGADALELGPGPGLSEGVEAVRARVDAPLCVLTADASVLASTLAAGAVVGIDPSGFADPDYLAVAAEASASVVALPAATGDQDIASVARELRASAGRAEEAGIPRSGVLVDCGLDLASGDPAVLALLSAHHCLTALGWPVSLSVADPPGVDGPAATNAALSVGIALGARIVRVSNVRPARRTADVLAAILRARADGPA